MPIDLSKIEITAVIAINNETSFMLIILND